MRKQKYIPQSLRGRVASQQSVKLPKRTVKTDSDELKRYYNEILLLYCDLAVDTSEKLLDCEIGITERLQIQKAQNEIYAISETIKKTLSDSTQDIHEDRVAFVAEITALATLVKPKFFKKMQEWFVKQVKNLHGLK